jgi:pimeloyl-ACP methyl ester carboxylesterase
MLPKAPPEVAIEVTTGDYNIGGGMIHARVLNGPRFHERSRPIRTALFIHGGGMGSNHTLLERPARWLIARDLFDQVILPDRRGTGESSPLVRQMALDEQADDLRRLLERMNIAGPLVALGMGSGGPLALVLAGLDARVGCVVLLASSPNRTPLPGLAGLLLRTGILRRLLHWEIRRSIGRSQPRPANFDPAYDARTPREMATHFREVLGSIPADRADSMCLWAEGEMDSRAQSAPASLALDLPILQLIGEGDEEWGGELTADLRRRFPNLTRRVVAGAVVHKDVFFKAEGFYLALFDFLKESCPLVI